MGVGVVVGRQRGGKWTTESRGGGAVALRRLGVGVMRGMAAEEAWECLDRDDSRGRWVCQPFRNKGNSALGRTRYTLTNNVDIKVQEYPPDTLLQNHP